MTDHRHTTYEPGCYRCDLSREEATNPLDPDVYWLPKEPERDYSGERGQ